jgi:hypothetical protein
MVQNKITNQKVEELWGEGGGGGLRPPIVMSGEEGAEGGRRGANSPTIGPNSVSVTLELQGTSIISYFHVNQSCANDAFFNFL